MSRKIIFFIAVFCLSNSAVAEDAFLNNILKNIDSKNEAFSDSFTYNDSLYTNANPVVLYKPGPSKSPLFFKRNEIYDLIDNIKKIGGIDADIALKSMLETLEDSFGQDYKLPELDACKFSRVITRAAAKPSLMPNEAVKYLYFDASSRENNAKTYRFGRTAVKYVGGKTISSMTPEEKYPLYLTEVFGVMCLPTYIETISGSRLKFYE